MTQELSQKRDSSQSLSSLQVKLLTIILKQLQSHKRQHSFQLGATVRSHLFGANQTYLAATQWAKHLDCSRQHLTRIIAQLISKDVLKKIKQSGWSVVQIGDVTVNLLEEVTLNAGDDVTVTNVEKTGSKSTCYSGCYSEAHLLFSLEDKKKAKSKENKHVDAVQHVTVDRKVGSSQPQLISTEELPEERRARRKSVRGVERASDLLKNPALKNCFVNELVKFNDRLSDLPDGVLKHKPRKGFISRHCVGKWRQLSDKRHRRHQFLETFLHDDELIFREIGQAAGAHGTNWFKFEWLLSFELSNGRYENQYGEHNIDKLLSGRYRKLNDWVATQRKQEKIMKGSSYESVADAGEEFWTNDFLG